MLVKIKKLSENAVMPRKAHPTDAGFDLTAADYRGLDFDGNVVYSTGLAIELPQGYVGLLFPRSSIARKDLVLSNCVGVLDAGYRGEVLFKFKPLPSDGTHVYAIGDRIGQLVVLELPQVEMVECEELSESERGVGGYGSSGA